MRPEIGLIDSLMMEFTERTGLSPARGNPRRYLWTDAFAVSNFLELHRLTNEVRYLELALALVDQVHHTLGRHREDDHRTGWLSGLSEAEGEEHPTRGGLRIGKLQQERGISDPLNEELEWDRDGQYYHYLTKWMHALDSVCRATGDPVYALWGIELAQAAHAAFAYSPGPGMSKRMHWKMDIDLSRPLVPSMGQHDPLDGYVTYLELQTLAFSLPGLSGKRYLASELKDMKAICKGGRWVTDDPLGIGGLLFDASRLNQLMALGAVDHSDLLKKVLDSAIPGVESFSSGSAFQLPSRYRLAFRELGLSIGLKAVERLNGMLGSKPIALGQRQELMRKTERLAKYSHLGSEIERFWTDPHNQRGATWLEHQDINSVMLATSLSPDSFLSV